MVTAGVSQIPGIPSLVGLDPKYLVEGEHKARATAAKNKTMKAMLASVNDTAMSNSRVVLSALQAARANTPAAGDAARWQGPPPPGTRFALA